MSNSVHNPLHNELKKEFQLERMILFSDAVFAIAITLLALEIKVPPIDRHIATDQLLLKSLDELMPKLVGFLISFFFIGLYWAIHHRMFGYVINYSQRLLWLNLLFLLAVVLMPFSTAFYSEYIFRLLKTPLLIYTGNIVFFGRYEFFVMALRCQSGQRTFRGTGKKEKTYFAIRSLLVPSVFLLVMFLYLFVNRIAALYIPMLIPLFMRLAKRFYVKKNEPK